MEFLRAIVGRLRDEKRYGLFRDLRAMGLDVRLSQRGAREEGISGGLMGNSLGLIEVRGSPIRWINLIEHPASRYAPSAYTNVYLVPDERVPSGGYVELKSVHVRDVSVHGRVINLRWTADFVRTRGVAASGQAEEEVAGDDIARRLDGDTLLKETLIRLGESITVRSAPSFWCWAISSGSYQGGSVGGVARRLAPSQEQWDCYQAIARYLLEEAQEK